MPTKTTTEVTTDVEAPLDAIKRLSMAIVSAVRSLMGCLPIGDSSVKGSMEKFTTLTLAVLRRERRQCNWAECHAAINVLKTNLDTDFEPLVRYILKSKEITFQTLGDRATALTARRTSVLEHELAKSYTLPTVFDKFAGRTAYSLAEDVGNPLKVLEIMNGSR